MKTTKRDWKFTSHLKKSLILFNILDHILSSFLGGGDTGEVVSWKMTRKFLSKFNRLPFCTVTSNLMLKFFVWILTSIN